ncbi:MAG: tetratricopeptide repeat protein [Desulfatiglandaceae bacterium]
MDSQADIKTYPSPDLAVDAGLGMVQKGEFKQALVTFTAAITLDQRHWEAYRLRGITYTRLGCYDSAIADFDSAVRGDPMCAGCIYERGSAKMFAGHLEGALADLSECLTLKSDFAPAYSIRAGIYTRMGCCKPALKDIDVALELEPDNAGYLHNRGVILTAMDRYDEAIENYEKALKLDPNGGGTYNNLAWLLATAKNSKFWDCRKAIIYAHKAVELGKIGAWLDTLAEAYAACGDFEKAVEAETQAYELSRPPNEKFRERVALYRCGKSYSAWRSENPVN